MSEEVDSEDDYLDAAALSYSSSDFEPDDDEKDGGVESSVYSPTPEDQDWATEVTEGAIRVLPKRSLPVPSKAPRKRRRGRGRTRRSSASDEDSGGEEKERSDDSFEDEDYDDFNGTTGRKATAKKGRRNSSKRGGNAGGGKERKREEAQKEKKRPSVEKARRTVADPPPPVVPNSLGFSGVTKDRNLIRCAQQCQPQFRLKHNPLTRCTMMPCSAAVDLLCCPVLRLSSVVL